jgi:hypothetical protein
MTKNNEEIKDKVIDKLVDLSIECGRVNEQIMTYIHEADEKGNATESSMKHYQKMHEYSKKLYNQIEVLKEVLNDR